MKRRNITAAAIAFGTACLVLADVSTPSAQLCAAEPQSFAEDVLPIFKSRCVSCHQSGGAGYEKSGLDLTSYEGLMKGTKFGAMVTPRDPEGSNLMWLLDWRASGGAHAARQQEVIDLRSQCHPRMDSRGRQEQLIEHIPKNASPVSVLPNCKEPLRKHPCATVDR